MKALCIADIHGDVETVARLEKSVRGLGLDYVLLFGDYSRGFKDPKENSQDIARILGIFKGYNIGALPGNCDQLLCLDAFSRQNANLHDAVLKVGGTAVIGFGGSNSTPFNTPFEYGEDEILNHLNHLHGRIGSCDRVVLAVHAPPYGTKCDLIPSGMHVGSKSIRQFIEDKKPDLVLCAHIHESGGAEDAIGETRVINLGRITDGRAYILDFDSLEVTPHI